MYQAILTIQGKSDKNVCRNHFSISKSVLKLAQNTKLLAYLLNRKFDVSNWVEIPKPLIFKWHWHSKSNVIGHPWVVTLILSKISGSDKETSFYGYNKFQLKSFKTQANRRLSWIFHYSQTRRGERGVQYRQLNAKSNRINRCFGAPIHINGSNEIWSYFSAWNQLNSANVQLYDTMMVGSRRHWWVAHILFIRTYISTYIFCVIIVFTTLLFIGFIHSYPFQLWRDRKCECVFVLFT